MKKSFIILLLFSLACSKTETSTYLTNPMGKWLQPTNLADFDDPEVLNLGKKITEGLNSPLEKVVKIHDWVRDNIQFGFESGFWKESASETLLSKRGFCNTKPTLFIALLRSQGIPARIQAVSMKQEILKGILDTNSDYVDHSYAKVFLNNAWRKTDSYILDPELFKAVQRKLREEEEVVGYGAVLGASNNWDGRSDSFSQYYIEGAPIGFINKEFGHFIDIEDFYDTEEQSNNGSWLLRLFFGFATSGANKKISLLRSS